LNPERKYRNDEEVFGNRKKWWSSFIGMISLSCIEIWWSKEHAAATSRRQLKSWYGFFDVSSETVLSLIPSSRRLHNYQLCNQSPVEERSASTKLKPPATSFRLRQKKYQLCAISLAEREIAHYRAILPSDWGATPPIVWTLILPMTYTRSLLPVLVVISTKQNAFQLCKQSFAEERSRTTKQFLYRISRKKSCIQCMHPGGLSKWKPEGWCRFLPINSSAFHGLKS
jgi:hypothetical protein